MVFRPVGRTTSLLTDWGLVTDRKHDYCICTGRDWLTVRSGDCLTLARESILPEMRRCVIQSVGYFWYSVHRNGVCIYSSFHWLIAAFNGWQQGNWLCWMKWHSFSDRDCCCILFSLLSLCSKRSYMVTSILMAIFHINLGLLAVSCFLYLPVQKTDH